MAERLRLVLLAALVVLASQALVAVGPQAASGTSIAAGSGKSIEFFARTPHGIASCAIYAGSGASTEAFCESFRPQRESKATVSARGKVSICASRQTSSDRCRLGNAGEGTPTFGYGHRVTIGPFRCAVQPKGVRCVVAASGKGFLFNPIRAVRVGP